MTTHAVIVSAGKGRRMNRATPKQYLPLQGMPVLGHTLLAFNQCPEVDNIILVVPRNDVSFCREQILSGLKLDKPIMVIAGGERRQDSALNGILSIDDTDGIVVIHDGVRPLVHPKLISRCIKEADIHGACILGIPLQDTLKSVDQHGRVLKTLLREDRWLAQTPQAFKYKLIHAAHEAGQKEGFEAMDDASLLENMGIPVHVIAGSKHNLKITTEEDFNLADAILAHRKIQL
jgi:2-C-methyl-D-erythritol 4-phosphate cytidylyltransferase